MPSRLVLLGHPVAQSLSPRFQNAALKAAGIPLTYEAMDVPPEALANALSALKADRAAGNVTVPHKERVHDLCDVLTPLAQRVGAVNTWWVDESGRLVGDNTDVSGFDLSARMTLTAEPRGLTVGVLGAGGAAAGVLAAVESWPECRVLVHNRTIERARSLCERFGSLAQPIDDVALIGAADLVVNATSIGLRDDSMPIDPGLLGRESAVVDLVYRPGETEFVRRARASGHRAADGIIMLWEQGAQAFERWFGLAPDRDVMWRALSDSPRPSSSFSSREAV